MTDILKFTDIYSVPIKYQQQDFDDLEYSRYSAVYELSKLKDRLMLTPEEERLISFLPQTSNENINNACEKKKTSNKRKG